MPATFIPIAEQTGIIADIGDWVIAEVASMLADWHRAGHQAPAGVQRQPAPARPGRFLPAAARRRSPRPGCRCRWSSWNSPRPRRWNVREAVLAEIAALRARRRVDRDRRFRHRLFEHRPAARDAARPGQARPVADRRHRDQREGAGRRPGGDPADQGRRLPKSSPRRSRTSPRPTSCAPWAATRSRASSSPSRCSRKNISPGRRTPTAAQRSVA